MEKRTSAAAFGFGFFLFIFEIAAGGFWSVTWSYQRLHHVFLSAVSGISLREVICTLFLKTIFLYGYIFHAGCCYDLHRSVLNAFLAN
jgi:hypothetical protein